MKKNTYEEPTLEKKTIKFFPIFFSVFFIFMIFSAFFRIKNYYEENNKTKDVLNTVSDISNLTEIPKTNNNSKENESLIKKEYTIDFKALRKINSDIVGYLIVPGTDISQTVVKGSDNDFYLHHNFYKQYDIAGWVFADYENKMDGTDQNIIIYGHNMKTGTMFGTLKKVLTQEWYNNSEYKYITYIDEKGTHQYEVFSVYIVESEDYYRKIKFSGMEYQKFIKDVTARSIRKFNTLVSSNDNILTLSTCHTDNRYRVVVHAKKIVTNNITGDEK